MIEHPGWEPLPHENVSYEIVLTSPVQLSISFVILQVSIGKFEVVAVQLLCCRALLPGSVQKTRSILA